MGMGTRQHSGGRTERDRMTAWLMVNSDHSLALAYLGDILGDADTPTLQQWFADADWLRGAVEKELHLRGVAS